MRKNKEQWKCPNDRYLMLRSKIGGGWSIHTGHYDERKVTYSCQEQQIIINVLARSKKLEQREKKRIRNLNHKLKKLENNVTNNDTSVCHLCGETFRLFISCLTCVTCNKLFKKSGSWFYGKQRAIQNVENVQLVEDTTSKPNSKQSNTPKNNSIDEFNMNETLRWVNDPQILRFSKLNKENYSDKKIDKCDKFNEHIHDNERKHSVFPIEQIQNSEKNRKLDKYDDTTRTFLEQREFHRKRFLLSKIRFESIVQLQKFE
ncbi:hypothetical protein A3Q56_00009 [Intoshia linei]|uniref:RabBD domain-containing protein n=1 Tax=Intoshia linei TaxID=1819745 RepID=A0A177BFC9_9BILA|nr:hypothetical protein A3Q56_00009 [Intoshia linei]